MRSEPMPIGGEPLFVTKICDDPYITVPNRRYHVRRPAPPHSWRWSLCVAGMVALCQASGPWVEADQRNRSSAAPGGSSLVGRAGSEAVARALARLENEPAPPDEVFAEISVTDRKTGERRMFTRGAPNPEFLQYLQAPESAPPGEAYAEGDHWMADGEVAVARRFITRWARSPHEKALTEEEEEELDLRRRNQDGGLSHRIEEDLRREILENRIDLRTSAPIHVVIRLRNVPRLSLRKMPDVTAGGLLWVGLNVRAERERAILERKRLVAGLQHPLIGTLERSGGRVQHASWTSGSVRAIVPATSLTSLAARQDVFSIELFKGWVRDVAYAGADYYVATDMDDYEMRLHDGRRGLVEKHSYTSRVAVAMSEECIDQESPAWLTGAPGSFNRAVFYDCDWPNCTGPGGLERCEQADCTRCSCENCDCPCHGNWVAHLMAGDFTDGQVPGLDDGRARRWTGTCPECRLLFYQDEGVATEGGSSQRESAWELACEHGVDIFESSIGSRGIDCDGNGSTDAELERLIGDCDVVYVQSAGNNGSTGSGCTTVYPADHPWTFTVGGMATSGSCSTANDYYTSDCVYDSGASQGTSVDKSIIDMTGPYRLGNLILPDTPAGFFPRITSGSGTSFAAPIVAGLMADFLDWWGANVSNSLFYDNRLRGYFLLFGDRSAFSNGVAQLFAYFDPQWGAGRVGLVPFDDMTNDGISRRRVKLDPGEEVQFDININDDATFFKAVVWQDGTDYTDEPIIELRLDPDGCETPTVALLTEDNKAMAVYADEPPFTELLDHCTHMHVTLKNVKRGSSGARYFHFGAYWALEDERNY